MAVKIRRDLTKTALILPLIFIAGTFCFSQESSRTNSFKAEVNLVQVEVRVTRDGKPVPGLDAEDFQVRENGTEQKISFLEYIKMPTEVDLEKDSASAVKTFRSLPVSKMEPSWIYLLPEVSNPLEFRRTAEAIREFINQELQPGFYVSLGGLPYTDNKDLLLYTLDRLEDKPYGKGTGISPELLQLQQLEDLRRLVQLETSRGGNLISIDDDLNRRSPAAYVARQIVFYGQLAIFRYMDLVERMALLPGKKSIVLFRDGLRMDRENVPLMDRLLAAAAKNRVSFYTVDARGLIDSSHDQPSGTMALAARGYKYGADPMYDNRRHQESEVGLIHLAENTGGQVVLNSNNMGDILTRVVEDSYSYYVLSYYPEAISNNGGYKKIDISLKSKNDCKVSSLRGYYEPKPVNRQSSNERLLSLKETMLTSISRDLRISGEPEVFADPEGKPLLYLSFSIPAMDFGLDVEKKKSEVEAELLLQVTNHYSLQMPLYQHTELKGSFTREDLLGGDAGLTYQTMLPLAPGYYHLKGIARDKKTGVHGIFTSSVVVRNLDAESVPSSLVMTRYAAEAGPEAQDDLVNEVLSAGGTVYYPQADHEFRKGDAIYALFHVYNATAADFAWAAEGVQAGLLKDDQPVEGVKIYGNPLPDEGSGIIRYVLMLETAELEPGEYTFMALLPNYPSRSEQHLEEQFVLKP